MTSKRELFIWKKHHDPLLLKEVVLEEPFKHNNGSKEKGASWSKIADALTQHGMKVTQRSVRERFDKLYSDFKEREREEKQASERPNLGIMSLKRHGYANRFSNMSSPSIPEATVPLLQTKYCGICSASARRGSSE